MNLAEFNLDEEIFIDSCIFAYHFDGSSPHRDNCSQLLRKVETREIKASISSTIIDEVSYVVLIQKGSEFLNTDKIRKIREEIKKDRSLASVCYQTVNEFYNYIEILRLEGLRIIETAFDITKDSTTLGQEMCLLPHDALTVHICKVFGIKHIATSDSDFEKASFLTVWAPSPLAL